MWSSCRKETHSSYRVYEEGFEILGLRTQLGRPGDLPFQDFVDGIHIVEVWTLGEQQLSPPGKQALKTERQTQESS